MSNQDLQNQINGLQQQIDALQQQLGQAQADSLAPNYLALDADGQVIANFPGIRLPTWLGTALATSSYVEWRNPGSNLLDGGVLIERDTTNNINYAALQSYVEQSTDFSSAWIQARDTNEALQAGVQASQQNNGATAYVKAQAGNLAYTVLDQAGNSSFVKQSNGLGQWTLTGDTAVLGGNNTSTITVNIAHGLGRTPVAWDARIDRFATMAWATGIDDTYIYAVLATFTVPQAVGAQVSTGEFISGDTYNLRWWAFG